MSEDYKPNKPPRRQANYVDTSVVVKAANNMVSNDKTQLNFVVDRKWHSELKATAAREGKSMVKLLYEAVELWTTELEKKRQNNNN